VSIFYKPEKKYILIQNAAKSPPPASGEFREAKFFDNETTGFKS
jgi:hypothetical protein